MSIEWPEEVVERVAAAIERADYEPYSPQDFHLYEQMALAALDALGGERVYVDDRSRTQIWLHRRHERPSQQSKKVEPALLVRLGGG